MRTHFAYSLANWTLPKINKASSMSVIHCVCVCVRQCLVELMPSAPLSICCGRALAQQGPPLKSRLRNVTNVLDQLLEDYDIRLRPDFGGKSAAHYTLLFLDIALLETASIDHAKWALFSPSRHFYLAINQRERP